MGWMRVLLYSKIWSYSAELSIPADKLGSLSPNIPSYIARPAQSPPVAPRAPPTQDPTGPPMKVPTAPPRIAPKLAAAAINADFPKG